MFALKRIHVCDTNGATTAFKFRTNKILINFVVMNEYLRAQVIAKSLVLAHTAAHSFDCVEAVALAEPPSVEKNVEEQDVRKTSFCPPYLLPSGKKTATNRLIASEPSPYSPL